MNLWIELRLKSREVLFVINMYNIYHQVSIKELYEMSMIYVIYVFVVQRP